MLLLYSSISGHVGVDLVVKRLPVCLQKVVLTLMDIILVLLNGYMAYLSVLYIQTSYTKMTPVLGVSSAYISSSVLIAFIMMTVYSIKFVYDDLFGKRRLKHNGILTRDNCFHPLFF